MNCPKCNHKTKVIDVETEGNVTYRLNKCPSCLLKVYTTERIDVEACSELSKIHARKRKNKLALKESMNG